MKKTGKLIALILAFCLCVGCLSVACAEETKYEVDKIRVGVASLPGNMDPQVSVGNATIRVHYNIYDTLLYADQDNDYEIKPMLAESWERIDDYTMEFKLRQGVKWHNGDEFTAKDVKFSFERLKDGSVENATLAASLMSTIDHVDIIDDYTCRIVTNTVDPLLEIRVASNWGAWILPADYYNEVGADAFTLNPVGTGPYKVTSFSPEKITMERFEDYWGEAPYIQTLEYMLYSENSTRITALMTGEADIITQLPMDQISIVESTPGLNVVSMPIENMHLVQFYITGDDPSENIVNDKKFRQALSYAIDRQLLSDAFWNSLAVVPRGHQYLQFGEMYFDDFEVETYDVEKAKELLAESSYNGEMITYELKSGYYTFGNEAAEAIVDMWKAIGVNAQVVFKDNPDDDTMVRNWSNSMRFPDPAGGLYLLWGAGEDWATMPQEFTDAGAVLNGSTDTQARKEAARTLMEIFREEVPGILLYYPVESWGVRDGLNWHPYASQTLNFRAENFWATEAE